MKNENEKKGAAKGFFVSYCTVLYCKIRYIGKYGALKYIGHTLVLCRGDFLHGRVFRLLANLQKTDCKKGGQTTRDVWAHLGHPRMVNRRILPLFLAVGLREHGGSDNHPYCDSRTVAGAHENGEKE